VVVVFDFVIESFGALASSLEIHRLGLRFLLLL
jgi:hypothetical protein